MTARRGVRDLGLGDNAIDDVSLSPECFGLGVYCSYRYSYVAFRILMH